MNEPFSFAQIEVAAYNLTRNTTSGRGKMPNKQLHSFGHAVLEDLLDYMNRCWLVGLIPPLRKHEAITLFPEPGETFTPKNLEPISLYTCVDNLF